MGFDDTAAEALDMILKDLPSAAMNKRRYDQKTILKIIEDLNYLSLLGSLGTIGTKRDLKKAAKGNALRQIHDVMEAHRADMAPTEPPRRVSSARHKKMLTMGEGYRM